jgi:hypothetical protein
LITLDTKVEDFVKLPGAMTYCIIKGVSLITCSDVFPDTLGKLSLADNRCSSNWPTAICILIEKSPESRVFFPISLEEIWPFPSRS